MAVLLGLIPRLSIAEPGKQGTLAREVQRYQRYFDKAHGAVVNGGVRPHAKVTYAGIHASLLVGGSASVGKATVTHEGMEHTYTILQGGASLGVDVGVGPKVGVQRYFAKPGANPDEVIPRTETKTGASFGLSSGMSGKGREGQLSTGWDLTPVRFGFWGEASGTVVRKSPHMKTSAMLRHLEEGVDLSRQAESALARGNYASARQILDRMAYLRQLVTAEKRSLNVYRAQTLPQ